MLRCVFFFRHKSRQTWLFSIFINLEFWQIVMRFERDYFWYKHCERGNKMQCMDCFQICNTLVVSKVKGRGHSQKKWRFWSFLFWYAWLWIRGISVAEHDFNQSSCPFVRLSWPMDSPHQEPVIWKAFSCQGVILARYRLVRAIKT